MSTNTLDELWNSPANRPSAASGEKIAAQFLARLRARRRFQAWWLGWTLLALTAIAALAIVSTVRGGLSDGAELSVFLPLLVLPWFAALYFARRFFQRNADAVRAGLPLRDVLVAARASNAAERRRLALVAALLALMLPLLALAIWQLHATGKASGNEAWSMSLVFGVALSLSAAGMALRYFRRLVPERRMIETLQRELEDDSAN